MTFPAALDLFADPRPPGAGQYVWLDGTIRDALVAPANILVASNPDLVHSTLTYTQGVAIQNLEAKVGIDGSAVVTSLDYLLKNVASVNPGHVHTPTSITGFIRTDGLSITSGSIPFAVGWSSAGDISIDKATPTFSWKYSGVDSAKLISNTTTFDIQGYTNSSGTNGQTIRIIGGTGGAPDANGGYVRLFGGAEGAGGDLIQKGFTVIGNTLTGFQGSSSIGGALLAGNTINDFAVEGSAYFQSNVIVAVDGIGLAGKLCPANYMLIGKGTAGQTIGVDRATTGAGNTLTLQGGWAQNGSSNQAGGNLILAPGKSTGTGTGSVLIQALGGGSSGTTDTSPTTVATWAFGTLTLIDAYNIVCGTTTGLKIGTATTQKIGFFNVTPVAQQANSIGIETVLSNFGLRVSGSAAPITIGVFSSTSTTDSTTNATGGGKFAGGVGIVKSLFVGGNISCDVAGKGLQIKEGANARMGTATLVAGTVTVSNTSVTANSRIFPSCQALGTVTTAQGLAATNIIAGTSFDIVSQSNTDTSTVAWIIVEKL